MVLYDAWARWRGGDLAAARGLLRDAGEAAGPVARDRAVLAALLAAEAGDRPEADRLLVQVEDPELWRDRPGGELEALAVQAARVRLTVDLATELELDQMLSGEPERLKLAPALFLTPPDAVLPALSQRVGIDLSFEFSVTSLQIPADALELVGFSRAVDDMRRRAWANRSPLLPESVANRIRGLSGESGAPFLPVVLYGDAQDVDSGLPWSARDLGLGAATKDLPKEPSAAGVELGLDLAVLAWRRWRLATRSLFLAHACEQAWQVDRAPDWLSLSIVGTLGAFSGRRQGSLELRYRDTPLDKTLYGVMFASQRAPAPALTADRVSFAGRLFRHLAGWSPEYGGIADWLVRAEERALKSPDKPVPLDIFEMISQEQCSLALYLLGPEPLDTLFRRIIGLPDSPVL